MLKEASDNLRKELINKGLEVDKVLWKYLPEMRKLDKVVENTKMRKAAAKSKGKRQKFLNQRIL